MVADPLPRDVVPDPDQAEGAYRGFLFADLRGYTSFVERHGDAAAADLLDAYRQLVRDEVAHHAGAEIRTEGDSFYVVFGSARRAVACGLAVAAAAERASRDRPERPIRVGIGINAGETVQRREGFVGSAVNLAARVCAAARPGELLVTAAVRDAVGSGAGLRFSPRGARRLKGISRPIPLFAVEPDLVPAHRRLPPLAAIPWLPVGVAAAAAISVGLVQELLAKLKESIEPHCERADDDDRPILRIDPGEASLMGVSPRLPVNVDAGLACDIPSLQAPDTVQFWSLRGTYSHRPVDLPGLLIINEAGATIPRGDCSFEGGAYDRWQVGDLGGWLLCREEFGDAILAWSYDGSAVYGTAVRRDGDRSALLRWWTAEARLLRT